MSTHLFNRFLIHSMKEGSTRCPMFEFFFEKNELVDLLIIRACHVDGVTVEIDRWRRGSVAEPAEEDGVIPPYY